LIVAVMLSVIKKTMTTFRCGAILFDLDGVLIDSTRSVDRQWRAWAREQGIDGEKVMAIAHGVRSLEVIRAVAPHLDAEAEVRRLENREANDQVDVAVMPGAADLINMIPDGRWAVVTSGTRDLATARLRLGGLRVPNVLVTAEDVVNGKPDPEPYLKAAELLRVKPEECLVIEDAPAGIRSARGGGMKVIGLASTYPAAKLGEADAVALKLTRIQVSLNGGPKLAVNVE
jgi:sugar-phosphatase